jgi:predicted DNA-binding transcriptional regulator YafY
MPTNNHALIRYRTIDRCLKSRNRNYFLKDLIKECSDAVHEYKEQKSGKSVPYKLLGRRTLMYDLKFMQQEFGAIIEHDLTDGYKYEDPNFEAFKTVISTSDKDRLKEALNILRQLSGESQFKDLESMVMRMEESFNIHRKRKDRSVIQFEHSTNIKGQKWVTVLKDKISSQSTLWIDYQPFGADTYQRVISPYLLKEYNNRWFLIGFDHDNKLITNLGLDRILNVKKSIVDYYTDPDFDSSNYAKDIVGVSISAKSKKIKLKIKAHGRQKYYLDTKPIHASQTMIKETEEFAIFQMELIPNFELQSKILSNIDTLEVMSPKSFKDTLKAKIDRASKLYSIQQ